MIESYHFLLHCNMKSGIHPIMHPVIFIDTSSGAEFITRSTLTSDETREVEGVPHYIYRIEISSASHPFYTGKQILVDTARRAEKFAETLAKSKTVADTRKGKKVKRTVRAQKKKAQGATADKNTEATTKETAQ